MLRRVVWQFTDVSEELIAPIIKAMSVRLLIALKEAVSTSET
jgi:hypothetical protein